MGGPYCQQLTYKEPQEVEGPSAPGQAMFSAFLHLQGDTQPCPSALCKPLLEFGWNMTREGLPQETSRHDL